MNEKEYLDYIDEWKKQNEELMESGKCRKVFLECLPKYKDGPYKDKINWKNSIGKSIYFIFQGIEGNIEIIDYISIKQTLIVLYNNEKHIIRTGSLFNCRIGNIIGTHTRKYKYNVDDLIDTQTGKIKILKQIKIKRKRKSNCVYEKGYEYKCLMDGNIDKIFESSLNKGRGCSICGHRKVIKGINDIATTHPHLVKYFNNIEDACTHSYASNKKTWFKCASCGNQKEMTISSFVKYKFHCTKCGDSISYPEKIIISLLNQLNLKFIAQLNISIINWCKKYRYDFYFKLNNEEYIIETHGEQHYKETTWGSGRTLKEEEKNDKNKRELAIKNGIKPENYIIIDCRKSELEFIKQNILNSRLNELFDLSKIDWIKAEKCALSNLVKEVCDLWSNGIHNTLKIANILNINRETAIKYLKIGERLNWCNYNLSYQKLKNDINKEVLCLDNGLIFRSIRQCSHLLKYKFSINISSAGISNTCNNKQSSTKGYHFKFIKDLTPKEYVEYNIEDKLQELYLCR